MDIERWKVPITLFWLIGLILQVYEYFR